MARLETEREVARLAKVTVFVICMSLKSSALLSKSRTEHIGEICLTGVGLELLVCFISLVTTVLITGNLWLYPLSREYRRNLVN